MKKIIALILALCLTTVLFTSCQGGASGKTVKSIQDKGEIVMYTNAAFPPFEYAGEGTEIAGVDVDIALEIAKELGVKLKIENVEFDGIVLGVKNGQADMGIAGMTVTDERKKSVDFSKSYITSVQYIIVNEGDDSVKTIEDLAGKKIGVQKGTTGDLIVSDEVNGYKDKDGKDVKGVLQDSGATVDQFKSAPEAALSLKSGKVDAVVIDSLPAQNIVTASGGLKTFEYVYADGSKTAEEYAVAIAKGNPELLAVIDKVIERLVSEGKIDEFVLNHTTETKN